MERSPWFNIWIHPKQTLRGILDTNPRYRVYFLTFLAGVYGGLFLIGSIWVTTPEEIRPEPLYYFSGLIGTVLLGIVIAFFNLFFGAWLLKVIGSWLKGKGRLSHLRCAIGWAYYPATVASILSIGNILSQPNIWLQMTFGLLAVVAHIWSFVITANLIGEAHQFSAWKGLLTLLIAAAMILFLLAIISAPIGYSLFSI